MSDSQVISSERIGRVNGLAEKLERTGVVGEEQARVWLLRTVFDHGRSETAEALDKPAKTVDNLWTQANKNVYQARTFFETFAGESDLVPVRKSNQWWHRDVFDRRACDHAYNVFTNKTHEFRYIPREELDSLSPLCSECFSEE